MSHSELVTIAEKAIQAVFEDTSVTPETTLNDLKNLRDRADEYCNAIEADLGDAEEDQ